MPPFLSLYIHWPYCTTKCPYCDFFSIVDTPQESLFFQAYARDLQNWYDLLGPRPLKTIFFGGGTPSLMDPKLVEFVIAKANTLFPFSQDMEITLEANPCSSDIQKFQNFKDAGVSRLSIGVQSFQEEQLIFLGRKHSAMEGVKAIENALKVFDEISFDLIYALPSQTLTSWEKDLKCALLFETKHLSLYQLVIEPGTAFAHRHERGEFLLPSSDVAADFYDLTTALTKDKNLIAYEISNYALPGHESQHNLTYWRYEDYIGIGPGAHSRITLHEEKYAHAHDKNLEKWFHHTKNTDTLVKLEREQAIEEQVLMGLRLKEGIVLKTVSDEIDMKKINTLTLNGIAIYDKERLYLTDLKRHQAVLRYLFS